MPTPWKSIQSRRRADSNRWTRSLTSSVHPNPETACLCRKGAWNPRCPIHGRNCAAVSERGSVARQTLSTMPQSAAGIRAEGLVILGTPDSRVWQVQRLAALVPVALAVQRSEQTTILGDGLLNLDGDHTTSLLPRSETCRNPADVPFPGAWWA